MTRILLVEDDSDIVNYLTEFLQGEGYAVDSVGGMAVALDVLSKDSFDLILLDVSLPDGNGYAVCSYAKKNSP